MHDYERRCRTLPSLQGQFTDVRLRRLFDSSPPGYTKTKLVRNFYLATFASRKVMRISSVVAPRLCFGFAVVERKPFLAALLVLFFMLTVVLF